MPKPDTGVYRRSGSTRWQWRIKVPSDLRSLYPTEWAFRASLDTEDLREANSKAVALRAQWHARFDEQRRELNPSSVERITPEMSKVLAQRVSAILLAGDDTLRTNPEAAKLLLKAVHKAAPIPITISKSPPRPAWLNAEVDPFEGVPIELAAELRRLNATMDAHSATEMSLQRVAGIMPMVQAEALKLGFRFDKKTPGALDALRDCLREYRRAFQSIRARDAGEVVETPAPSVLGAPVQKEKATTLRDVFDRWKRSGATPRKEDSIQAMDRTLRQFEGKHPSAALRDITREMGEAYRSWLMETCRTPKTARDRLTGLKTLLKYAFRDLEWTQRHTWEGLDIKAKTTNKRRAITEGEMRKLFGTSLHTEYALPKIKQGGQDAAYWIPLLGAFTGARLGELCQLRTVDVQTVDGIPALALTDDGEDQSIKTEAGRRTIPIHSELIRLGFMDYARAMKEAGNESLWPALPIRKGKPSDFFGRWFREFRKELGMEGPGAPSFHYFRHTVRPLMRRAGFDAMTRDLITGHEAGGSIGDRVYDGLLLAELRPAVEAIQYPGLALQVVAPHVSR